MKQLPSVFDPQEMAREAHQFSFTRDGTGVEMAHPQAKGLPKWLDLAPAIKAAVQEIEQVTGARATGLMLNRLAPGVSVPKHTDAEGGERWHLPLETNPQAMWWDENDGEVHMAPGFWWGPVPYDIPHRVVNLGDTPRTHLVVDVAT